jgi:hypothetical protein
MCWGARCARSRTASTPSNPWRAPTLHTDPPSCFVGSLGYGPNVASAHRLVHEVAPGVWRRLPTTRFVLAGRQPAPSIVALAGDRVDVMADVASVVDVFADSDVACFPDREGLGIRNSVTEALAAGLPVVATPQAAREQPAHPLLRVGEGIDDLVTLVVGCSWTPPAGRRRLRHADVGRGGADYLQECRPRSHRSTCGSDVVTACA